VGGASKVETAANEPDSGLPRVENGKKKTKPQHKEALNAREGGARGLGSAWLKPL